MKNSFFILPQKDEMLQRLIAVDDSMNLQQRFYPLLLERAGEQKVAMGIVLMLQLAIHDYTQGMPESMVTFLNMKMNGYIDALCPDEEIASNAKKIFEATVNASSQG